MSAKVVLDFVMQFGVKLNLNEDMLIEREGRYFLLNNSQAKTLVKDDFFYAGIFLGKVRMKKFFPSFNLLSMIATQEETNRVIVDKKAGWLFICGRDVFKKGILRVCGRIQRNCPVLVINEFNECLGFGRVLTDLEQQTAKNVLAVANVLDVGDFLRRERNI